MRMANENEEMKKTFLFKKQTISKCSRQNFLYEENLKYQEN